jgi:hypothetical protein
LIYKIRVYEAAEGRGDAMRRTADPQWLAVKAASEADRPLRKNQMVSVLPPAIAGAPPGQRLP